MRYLWPVLFILVGFKSEPTMPIKKSVTDSSGRSATSWPMPRFSIGECALFADQPGRPDKTMIVRVEGYQNGRYLYRWWTFQHQWSIDLGTVVAERSMFDRLFKIATCPDSPI